MIMKKIYKIEVKVVFKVVFKEIFTTPTVPKNYKNYKVEYCLFLYCHVECLLN